MVKFLRDRPSLVLRWYWGYRNTGLSTRRHFIIFHSHSLKTFLYVYLLFHRLGIQSSQWLFLNDIEALTWSIQMCFFVDSFYIFYLLEKSPLDCYHCYFVYTQRRSNPDPLVFDIAVISTFLLFYCAWFWRWAFELIKKGDDVYENSQNTHLSDSLRPPSVMNDG